MADNVNNTETPMNANELSHVNGGSLMNGGAFEGAGTDSDWFNPKDLSVGSVGDVHNTKDQVVGRIGINGTIQYWPCPNCRKPMHEGALGRKYCDPCNSSYIGIDYEETWHGSKIELSTKSL